MQKISQYLNKSQKLTFNNIYNIITSNNPQFYIKQEEQYGCHNYHPLPIVLKKGRGVFLYDVQDKQYFDFLSAYSAVNQGHCHKKILNSLFEQASELTLTSRAFYNNRLGEIEKFLCELFKYDKALLMNSGVEAGESAVKLARRWAYEIKGIPNNKAKVLFAKGNFWGRTIAACASSDDPSRYKNFGPFDLNFELIDYNNLDALEEVLKRDPNVAAYFFEPIQGEKGVIIPEKGYLQKVRELCTKYNVLMIVDEIQTGLGRTGKLICSEHEQVRPDMILLGKALSGGMYPVSAVLCDDPIMMTIRPGDHGSTYGGNPLGSAVALTALQVLLEENMIENSQKMGDLLLKNLNQMRKDYIKDIRGKGLFCAIEFDEQAKGKNAWDLCLKLAENGVLAKPTHNTTIRLSPPLIITESQINHVSEILDKCLQSL